LYQLQPTDNDEREVVGGMSDEGIKAIGKNLRQCCFVHHKSHMI
jgi:hypothetical protein